MHFIDVFFGGMIN